jgi:SsrA-binding protein
MVAPRQELGVLVHIGYQRVHFAGGVPNQNGFIHGFHRIRSMAKNTSKKSAAATGNSRIADNKKAAFNYFFEERFEAGLVLEGWEVKSLREGKVQLTDGYIVIREGELFIIGLQINPLHTASSHVSPDKVRTKKLLMHKEQIMRLIGKVEQKGYTLVPTHLYWKNGRVKCEIALAKGKAEHDKRDTIKDREGKREVERAMKSRKNL